MPDIGTVVIAGAVVPIEKVWVENARVYFLVTLGPEIECRHLEREEYRIHGVDGSMLALVDRVSTKPIRKRRGQRMTLDFPLSFVDNRARHLGA